MALFLLPLFILLWFATAAPPALPAPTLGVTEEVVFKVLPDGKILARFHFTNAQKLTFDAKDSSNSDHSGRHYGIFPRPLAQIVEQAKVAELHLSFAKNAWNVATWGLPVSSVAAGAEVYAWLEDPESVDDDWKNLISSLSGLFCASLNFVDDTVTTSPKSTFFPQPDTRRGQDLEFRYGALPRETVCTENLTPWVKLLPCQHHAGLGQLLSPAKIFDSHHHSMAIHLQKICEESPCVSPILKLTQTLAVVFENDLGARGRSSETLEFSLNGLFGKGISGSCPLSSSSLVKISHPERLTIRQPLRETWKADEKAHSLSLDLKDPTPFSVNPELDLLVEFEKSSQAEPQWLRLSRKVVGATDESGQFITALKNDHPSTALNVTYFDWIPWFLRVYLHTAKVEIDGQVKTPGAKLLEPSTLRGQPTVLEFSFVLPPATTVRISFDFDKTFLKLSEHRPDANRGFDISGAILRVTEASPLNRTLYLHTIPLLVPMPTPDFSMPYNVITLTCTVIALFFGSIFNTSIRSFRPVKHPAAAAADDPAQPLTLKQKLLGLFRRKEKAD